MGSVCPTDKLKLLPKEAGSFGYLGDAQAFKKVWEHLQVRKGPAKMPDIDFQENLVLYWHGRDYVTQGFFSAVAPGGYAHGEHYFNANRRGQAGQLPIANCKLQASLKIFWNPLQKLALGNW